MSAATSRLFEPISLGSKRAANRIMRLATTNNLAENYRVSPRMIGFYAASARGRAGSIVTESLRVHPSDSRSPAALALYDRAAIPGMRQLAEAVQKEGALLIGQVNHGGRQNLGRGTPVLLAPSEVGCPRSGGNPHAMTGAEVEAMAEAFVTAALHCLEAGLDGVEVHGAQGHLIGQFVSPFSNHRDDRWGGSLENRMRFPRAVLAAIRRRGPAGAIIGYRLGVEEFTDGGFGIEAAEEVASALTRDGLVDYLSLSQGNFNSIETHLPDRHYPPAPYRDLHRRIRAVANGVPVIAGTRVQTPEVAEQLLADGVADAIGFCRAFIADPAWPAKARGDRSDPIRRCIACNQCWGWISEGQPIACAINPEAGREHALGQPKRAEASRRVVIVGAGPAGLETARVAARRGHAVTVIERADSAGGRLREASLAPNHGEIGALTEFLHADALLAGADLRFSTEADVEAIAALQPDVLILATGATAEAPGLAGDGSVPVLAAPGLPPRRDSDLRNVVVMDEEGYFWAAGAAESAIAAGYAVVLVSRFFEVLRDLPVVTRIATLRALDQAGTQLRPNMAVHRVENGHVILRHYLSGREERIPDCRAVIWTGRQRSENELAAPLRDRFGSALRVIGDAYQPRWLPNALLEGHMAGRDI